MQIFITVHAHTRLKQRGISESEVNLTLRNGHLIPANHGMVDFVLDFTFSAFWHGNYYKTKELLLLWK